jgi:hypothetical protein
MIHLPNDYTNPIARGLSPVSRQDIVSTPVGKQLDVLPAVSTTQHSQNRQNEDFLELMGFDSIHPGIFDRRHALDQTQLCNHSMDSSKRKGSVSDIFHC